MALDVFFLLTAGDALNRHPKTLEIQCAKRTGKQRYPSEKKKLKLKRKALTHVNDKFQGIWRLSKLGVPVQLDPGKDFIGVSEGLLQEIAKVIKFPVKSCLDSKEIEEMKRDEGLPFSICAFQFFFCLVCLLEYREQPKSLVVYVCGIFMGLFIDTHRKKSWRCIWFFFFRLDYIGLVFGLT